MNWLKKMFGKSSENDYANFYDFETKKVSSIAVKGIQPYMVQAEVESIGLVWVDSRQLKISPHQHSSFPEEVREILQFIKDSLNEVRPLSLEDWEDGFLRDAHPEREIAIWLHIAELYNKLTSEKDLSVPQKQDYFSCLLACSFGSREDVFKMFQPKVLSKEEAERIIGEYYKI